MSRPILTALALSLASFTHAGSAPDPHRWGDQGDGTFRNPILPGDYSDPDVIRVGPDYYLIASTFQYSPGMAILGSKDLVNWRFIGHCIPSLANIGAELNWDRMDRYGRGVYAGSLRYHAGRFWMFTTTLDEGVFMTTAERPEGPWTPAVRIWDRKGVDDDCPFWDDDGQAYLLFSTPGNKWYTRIVRMAPDGRSVFPETERVIDAHQTSEGNKIYKINGWYYIFHNQCEMTGADATYAERVGVFMRSRNIWGPYEKRVVLRGRRIPGYEGEPNQGGLVQTEKGGWWFVTQQGSGSFSGRASHLLPVKWVDDWPVIGEQDELGIGTIAWSGRKPIEAGPARAPQASDNFTSPVLSPQWEWNYEPRLDFWSLTERPGFLRLRAFKPVDKPDRGVVLNAGNTLTQRLMTPAGGTATATIDITNMADGQTAGFVLFSREYGGLGISQTDGKRRLVYLTNAGQSLVGPELKETRVWLRAVMDDQGQATFLFSTDGARFVPFGEQYRMKWAWYRGIRLALCSYNEQSETGWVDVDAFDYTFPGPSS